MYLPLNRSLPSPFLTINLHPNKNRQNHGGLLSFFPSLNSFLFYSFFFATTNFQPGKKRVRITPSLVLTTNCIGQPAVHLYAWISGLHRLVNKHAAMHSPYAEVCLFQVRLSLATSLHEYAGIVHPCGWTLR